MKKSQDEIVRELFVCGCCCPEHQFIFEYWCWEGEPESGYAVVYVCLTQQPLWRRVITALRHVLGFRDKPFEEVMLERPDVIRLRDALDKFLTKTTRKTNQC